MISVMLNPLVSSVIEPIGRQIKKQKDMAYFFTGQQEYALFGSRAIDLSLPVNVIRFKTGDLPPSVVNGTSRVTIIAQQKNLTTFTQREFYLVTTDTGTVQFVLGGSFNTFNASLLPHCHFEVVIDKTSGTTTMRNLTNNTEVSRSLIDGGAREPDAPTMLAALVREDGTYSLPFIGQLYDIEVDGMLWPMKIPSEIQPSIPAGNSLTMINMKPENWLPLNS